MQLNDNTSHPSAFISSTFLDLKAERRAVAETLRRAGINVNALDVRPASTNTVREEILSGIRESDFVILIVANRYGSCVPWSPFCKASVTEWEYYRAVSFGKSIQVYFFPEHSDLACSDSLPVEDAANAARLKQFREKLKNKHNPGYFESIEELVQQVGGSLIQVYRDGVRHHLRRYRPLEEENAAMKKLLTEKERRILDLQAKVTGFTRSQAEALPVPPILTMPPTFRRSS